MTPVCSSMFVGGFVLLMVFLVAGGGTPLSVEGVSFLHFSGNLIYSGPNHHLTIDLVQKARSMCFMEPTSQSLCYQFLYLHYFRRNNMIVLLLRQRKLNGVLLENLVSLFPRELKLIGPRDFSRPNTRNIQSRPETKYVQTLYYNYPHKQGYSFSLYCFSFSVRE